MKVGNLIDLLLAYNNDDDIEIEVYYTISRGLVDSTFGKNAFAPSLKVDVESKN